MMLSGAQGLNLAAVGLYGGGNGVGWSRRAVIGETELAADD